MCVYMYVHTPISIIYIYMYISCARPEQLASTIQFSGGGAYQRSKINRFRQI